MFNVHYGGVALLISYGLPALLNAAVGLALAYVLSTPLSIAQLPASVAEGVRIGGIGAFVYALSMLSTRMFQHDITTMAANWSAIQMVLGPLLGGVCALIFKDQTQLGDFNRQVLYFFNSQKDRLALRTHTVDGKLRVDLTHLSAAELAEIDRLFREEEERKKNQKPKELPKYAVVLPAGAKDIEQPAKGKLEFTVATGKGKAAAEALRKQLAKDGWKEKEAQSDAMAGTATFTRETQELSLTWIDPGLIPAEIMLSGSGVELERGKGE
jgi:hypothetical protein